MPVDSTSFRTDLQSDPSSQRVDLPIASPEFYRDLQVPQPILQDTKLLAHFFSTQGARLHSMETVERIKSLSADIPEFDEVRGELENFAPLQPAEEKEFGDFFLGIQSGADVDQLIRRAEQYVQEHPESQMDTGGGSQADIFDQVFMTEMNEGRDERDRRYQELIAAAKDPETAVLLLAYRFNDFYGQKLQKAVEFYRDQINGLDQGRAMIDLSGGSSAEIAKANADLARQTSFMGMASFAIQSIKQKMDQTDNTAKSLLDNIQESSKQIIANLRG